VTLTRTAFFPNGSTPALMAWYFRARQGGTALRIRDLCQTSCLEMTSVVAVKNSLRILKLNLSVLVMVFFSFCSWNQIIRMFPHNPGTVIGKGVFHFCRQDWSS
jgi:hypothetical protein